MNIVTFITRPTPDRQEALRGRLRLTRPLTHCQVSDQMRAKWRRIVGSERRQSTKFNDLARFIRWSLVKVDLHCRRSLRVIDQAVAS